MYKTWIHNRESVNSSGWNSAQLTICLQYVILPAFENAIMDAPTITDAAGIMYAVDKRWAKFYSPIVAVSYLLNPILVRERGWNQDMLNKNKEFLFHHYDADSRGRCWARSSATSTRGARLRTQSLNHWSMVFPPISGGKIALIRLKTRSWRSWHCGSCRCLRHRPPQSEIGPPFRLSIHGFVIDSRQTRWKSWFIYF